MINLQKILLLPMCGLGDAVCYLPTLVVLRRFYPKAEITAVVATAPAGAILESSPAKVEVIVFNRGGQQRGLRPLMRLVRSLRRRQFDVVISGAHPDSVRVPIFAALCGASMSVGSSFERLSSLYSKRIDVSTSAHYVDRYRRLLEGIDLTVAATDFRPSIAPAPEARASASKLWEKSRLNEADFVLGIISGADVNSRGRWQPHLKRWNNEGYAGVATWAAKERGARVVMFGSADEAELAASISALSGVPVVNLCGKTGLRELPWLLKWCTAIVGNDTGTMHMAGAIGTKMVSLFGPTSPDSFLPPGHLNQTLEGKAPCGPCYPNPTCERTGCLAMNDISPTQVIQAIDDVLHSNISVPV